MKRTNRVKRMLKRSLIWVVALSMVLFELTGVTAHAAGSTFSVSTADQLKTAISNAGTGDTIDVVSDITISKAKALAFESKNLTIKSSNGSKLIRGSDYDKSTTSPSSVGAAPNIMIRVGKDATLILQDIVIDGSATTGQTNQAMIWVGKDIASSTGPVQNSSLVLSSGAVLQNAYNISTSPSGLGAGAVYSEGAVTVNDGAKICGSKAKYGGGLTIKGTFTMNGGELSGNIATHSGAGDGGAAVSLWNGAGQNASFVMNGGVIKNNSATTCSAGAVYLYYSTGSTVTFTMNGGQIIDNYAYNNGGGVVVDASSSDAILNISGSATINNNTAGSSHVNNNIYLNSSVNKFNVTGALSGVLGVISGGASNGLVVGQQSGYTLTASDVTAFIYDTSGYYIKPFSAGDTQIQLSNGTSVPTINTLSVSDGTIFTPYSTRILANGNPAPTFSISSGALPGGLSINGTTGVISGTPTNTGSYTFTVAATNSQGSAAKQYTLLVYSKEAKPDASVDYASGKLTGLTPNASYKITVDGTTATVTADAEGKIDASGYYGKTVSIVSPGNGSTTLDSDAQTIAVSAKPAAPSAGTFSVTNPSSAADATSEVSGITAAYEYSTDGGSTWTTGSGSTVIITAGDTVLVRVKATGDAPASESTSVATAAFVRTAGSITITSDPSKTYDGSPVADPAVSQNGTGAVTYSYYTDNSGAIGTVLANAPSDPGTYWVKAEMAQDSNYTSAEATRQFAILAAAGELTASFSNSGYTGQNLTTLGDVDWAVWGYAGSGTSTSLSPDNRKAGGTAISALTDIDPGTDDELRGLGQFRINHTFNWSNGTSPASATSVYCGLQHNVQATNETGDGFSFTVPADTQKRRLIVYSAVHYAVGELTATLSDGSAAQVTVQQDCKTAVNSPSRFVIDYAAGSDGQTLTIKFVVTWNSNDGNGNAQIYAVALSDYHAATINIRKDGELLDAAGSVELRQSGSTVATAASAGTAGVYSALVLNGIYDIYIDGADTGTDLVINAADNSATINYYTVSYAVADANKASGSTISATAGGSAITSGSVVLSGKQIVLTATGNGADSYTYAWTGEGTSGQTTRTLTVPSLSGKMNALCTVSGTLKLPTPAGLLWDSTTPGKAVWSAVANASGYSVQLYKNGSALGSAVSVAAGTMYYDFSGDISAAGNGLYTFKVTAKGDGTSYSDSAQSSASGGYDRNTAPAFAGSGTTLTVDENSSGNSISVLLHASDIDIGQTLTWSEKTAPGHGALTFTGATASTGSADITPGGTITYTPAAGYHGSDSFAVQVSDGKATAERTVSVAVTAVPDKLPVPSTLSWDSTAPGKATWSAVSNASGYSVQLYKDGIALGSPVSVPAGTQSFDFTSAIKAAGSGLYTFKVTAKGDGTEYCDSDVSFSISIFNYVAPVAANAANNSAAANPASVTLGGSVTLTAAGDRQNEPGVAYGDERYVPATWASTETGKAGSFEKNGNAYTSTYTPSAAGSHTVTVTFIKQIYNGTSWTEVSGSAVTKTVVVTSSQKYFTVRFEDWDGTLIKQQSVAGGAAAAAPADPVRTGYTFMGWSASYDVITADLTVTAQYKVSSFTVRFKDWDGTVIKTQTVPYGQAAASPLEPKRTGYTFAGWDKGYDEITKNMTLTAQYTINTYTVIFNADGGSAVDSQQIVYGGSAVQPKAPVKDGFSFGGWYSDSGLGNAYDFSAKVAADITLYAKWTQAAGLAQAAAQSLTLETAFKFAEGDTWECITSSFVMLGGADSGAKITWASSNAGVVRIEQNTDGGATGVVTRPADNDVSVVITATVSKGGESVSKTFLLIVKRQGASKDETRKATDRTANVQAGDGTSGATICRTTLNDGTSIDYVTLSTDTVLAVVKQGSAADHIVVTIDNDENDQADEFAFEVSSDTVLALVQNGLGVTLESPAGAVTLSAETLQQASQSGASLYFRIVPVADEAEEAEEAFRSDGAVFSLSNAAGQVFGTPKTIQTNMESFATTITLPLEGLSEQQLADEEFLKSLCVYVEHDDGTTELVYGTLVYTDNVPTGIQFDISKFSRFQVVSVAQAATASPWGWIAGVAGVVLLLLVITLALTLRRRRQVQP